MASSLVEIYNIALIHLGVSSTIISTSDELASSFNVSWPSVSDQVARAYNWNCLRNVDIWAPTTDEVVDSETYSHIFTLPENCVRVVSVDRNELPWEVRKRKLLTVTSAPKVVWTEKVPTDVGQLDACFVAAVSIRLAWATCFKITQSNNLKEQLQRDFRLAMIEARSIDSQEGTPDSMGEGSWVDTHNLGEF